MSTATAEPSVETNVQESVQAPSNQIVPEFDLEKSLGKAMDDLKAKETPRGKQTEKQEDPKTTEKQDVTKEEKAAEPTKAEKKKSALDSIISDEAKPELDEVTKLIESKDPNWDKARETMRKQSEELKAYKAAQPKAPEIPAEIQDKIKRFDEITAENKKLRDSIVEIDVRYDPSTIEKQERRTNHAVSLATRVKESGGDVEAFETALAMKAGSRRSKALDAALENIESGTERAAITRKLGDIELMDEELEGIYSKPQESYEQLRQKQELQSREHREKAEQFKQAVFEKAKEQLPKLSKFMKEAPADSEGADEFNAQLRADLEKAPSLLNIPPEEVPIQAFKAARYDTVEKLFVQHVQKSSARIAELEGTLAKYEDGEMKFRGGAKPSAKKDYERPLEEVFMEAMNGQAPV